MFRASLLDGMLCSVVLVVLIGFSPAQCSQNVGDSCKMLSGGAGVCRDFDDCDMRLLAGEPPQPAICAWQDEEAIVCCPQSDEAPRPELPKIKDVGDSCELKSGGTGVCQLFDDCDLELLGTNLDPVTCAWRDDDAIICCSQSAVKSAPHLRPKLSKAKQKCMEYKDIKNSVVPTILGGEEVQTVSQYPHIALLGYGKPPVWQCGGTLISDQYILTAAHCLNNIQNPVTTAQLGFLDKRNRNASNTLQEFSIVQTHSHPTRKRPQHYADIALLKLDRPVQYTKGVVPACLHEDFNFPVDKANALGWGVTTGGPRTVSEVLQRVQIPLRNFNECSNLYPVTRRLPQGLNEETQFCAGEQGKDTCQGDSGGPLQIHDTSGMAKIIGVTSFGQLCGQGIPGVYTRVSHYVPWIEGIIWP